MRTALFVVFCGLALMSRGSDEDLVNRLTDEVRKLGDTNWSVANSRDFVENGAGMRSV